MGTRINGELSSHFAMRLGWCLSRNTHNSVNGANATTGTTLSRIKKLSFEAFLDSLRLPPTARRKLELGWHQGYRRTIHVRINGGWVVGFSRARYRSDLRPSHLSGQAAPQHFANLKSGGYLNPAYPELRLPTTLHPVRLEP